MKRKASKKSKAGKSVKRRAGNGRFCKTGADAGAGRGGVVPPVQHQFKPGQSGNPAGRPPSAGATLTEHLNAMVARGDTEEDLRGIIRRARTPAAERAAAIRLLQMLEYGDTADFQEVADGVKSLKDLREEGICTAVVKRVKTTTRTTGTGDEKAVEVSRELELHSRSGEEFDRVCDRTHGRPTQAVKLSGSVQMTKRIVLVRDTAALPATGGSSAPEQPSSD